MSTTYAQQMLDALSAGQLEKAQQLFVKSLRKDSDDLVYSLAEELYALGFLNQSRRAYKKLLNKYPDEDEIRTALADIAIEDGNIDEAQDYLAQIMPDSTSYLQSLLVKADIYQSEGLNESAEHSLLQAEKIAGHEDIIQFALAEFYYANQAYQNAIPRYRELLLRGQREISRVDIVARIGVAYAQVGNYENAVGYLEQIKPETMSVDTRFQLGVLYQENARQEDAIKVFNDILEIDPKYTSIYPLLGQAYESQQDIESAYRTYQVGLSEDETNTRLYRLAGSAAEQIGDIDAAKAYYQQALVVDDEDVTTIILLSSLLLSERQFEEDINLLTQYIANDVIDPQFYWDLARANGAIGNEEETEKNWLTAEPYFQENTQFLSDIIAWYHEQGNQELEIKTMQQYLFLEPDDADMQMRLEDLLF
ncbi:tetratricopeptide repeat protein [Leuconostoc carnosum]|uniref:tetratricopeptide repeat protein n=1 Tax=Leuconostoc TaxID=1243 RepID=UPI000D51CD23|nr:MULTISPECIES: tetratricopeptide repeat protein [Leuconostoc]KAA8325386.1 tetratricopeptide repeat protein [Leuconostoc carnosum]KAA8359608.1 tetratricopeptide repeat protein [Leuconostoc carnosum]KAA8365183.1 tetratricopeptide repeat protein [Leuconostoc carnosum]KAA8367552.1 tetratricopeptide repeat protein [Leuconostoc carnosum]KAA8372745.1 tetratricopeptide repeat protein [Leuconostoc carnosum]